MKARKMFKVPDYKCSVNKGVSIKHLVKTLTDATAKRERDARERYGSN